MYFPSPLPSPRQEFDSPFFQRSRPTRRVCLRISTELPALPGARGWARPLPCLRHRHANGPSAPSAGSRLPTNPHAVFILPFSQGKVWKRQSSGVNVSGAKTRQARGPFPTVESSCNGYLSSPLPSFEFVTNLVLLRNTPEVNDAKTSLPSQDEQRRAGFFFPDEGLETLWTPPLFLKRSEHFSFCIELLPPVMGGLGSIRFSFFLAQSRTPLFESGPNISGRKEKHFF